MKVLFENIRSKNDGLNFEVITLEQIRRTSTVQVEDPRTYDAGLLDEPQLGG